MNIILKVSGWHTLRRNWPGWFWGGGGVGQGGQSFAFPDTEILCNAKRILKYVYQCHERKMKIQTKKFRIDIHF